MADLVGYIYCSRPERWYSPEGDPNSWPGKVHVHAAYSDGSSIFLGTATYKASFTEYYGIGNGYRTERDVDYMPGYYNLVPATLRHISLPPEQQRTYRWHTNEIGASLLANIGDTYDIPSTIAIDPDTEYVVWVFWEPLIGDWGGYFPWPYRIAALTPIRAAMWQGMQLNADWDRFIYASDAVGAPQAFWTDFAGTYEVF